MRINTRTTMNRILYLILLSFSLFVIFLLIRVISHSALFTIPMVVFLIISFDLTFVFLILLFLRIKKVNTIKIDTKIYVLFSLLLSASLFVFSLVCAERWDDDISPSSSDYEGLFEYYPRYKYIPVFVFIGITIALAFVYLCVWNKDVIGAIVNVIGVIVNVIEAIANVIDSIVNEDKEDPFDIESGMPRKFTFNDLTLATSNFNKKLGRGGFGSVFKGNLGNIRKVAVKRLDQAGQGSQGKKEFLAEVETMGSLHHVNLVRLIGFCAENSHKLLVYEYMCNSSLDKWIFHHNPESSLDWPTRRKIILHIAQGLSYLHRDCHRTIIHLDIKPQNILLDANFNAKIADFGLARFIETDQNHVSTVLKGTPGYWAPEWWLKKKINEKTDVYSFGVVVLEIITGRQSVDHSLPEEKHCLFHLVKKKAEENRLFDLVDKQSDDMQQHKEEAVRIIRTAIWCLQTDSTNRPSMSMVVNILEGLMDIETITDYSFLTWTPMELPRQSGTSGTTPNYLISEAALDRLDASQRNYASNMSQITRYFTARG